MINHGGSICWANLSQSRSSTKLKWSIKKKKPKGPQLAPAINTWNVTVTAPTYRIPIQNDNSVLGNLYESIHSVSLQVMRVGSTTKCNCSSWMTTIRQQNLVEKYIFQGDGASSMALPGLLLGQLLQHPVFVSRLASNDEPPLLDFLHLFGDKWLPNADFHFQLATTWSLAV